MPSFRVAWETFVGLVTGEDLLTGTAPLSDAGGNGRHRRRVSPATLARLQAQAQRVVRRGRAVQVHSLKLPDLEPQPLVRVEDDGEALEVLRIMGML